MASTPSGRKARAASPPAAHGLIKALQRVGQIPYAGDYLGLALLLAAYLVIQFTGQPFHQLFRLNDPRIQFPHADVERVSVFWLFVYAAGIPAAALMAWAVIVRPGVHKVHVTMLGLLVSILLSCFVVDVLKDAVGRPRPDLIARCRPDLTTLLDELVTIDVCTETRPHLLQDGWRSFPSGHSSFAFAGFGYLAMFAASQTHALRPRANLAVVLLCIAPLLGAALIAISRLEDYRHDHADVICGSLIGLLVAYLNWRRYYPSLLSNLCNEPFTPPSSGRTSPHGAFQRVRDEEEGYELAESGHFSIGEEGDVYNRENVR